MKRPLFKASALVAALVAGAWLQAAPPPNDNLANAQLLTGDFGALIVDTTDATLEEYEPVYGYNSSMGPCSSGYLAETNTVWYKWQSPAKAKMPIHFDVTGLDDGKSTYARIIVFTGTSYEDLVEVYDNCSYGYGRGDFCAEPGRMYLIRLDTGVEAAKVALWWRRDLVEGEWKILAADGIVLEAFGDLPKDLKSSDFPAGVTEILEWSFDEMITTSPKFVTIPATVKKIGDHAFSGLSKLAWVDYDGDVAAIDVSETAFSGTPYSSELPFKLILDEGVRTNVTLTAKGDVVTNVESYCEVEGFVGTCPAELVIPEGVTRVCGYAFSGIGNEGLTKVTFPSTLKTTKYQPGLCYGESTLQAIGAYAFSGCEELEEVAGIPAAATINDYAFTGSLYEKVRPFEVVTREIEDLDYDYETATYTITTNLWAVGFHGTCPESVTIPDGVYGIYYSAFSFSGENFGNRRSVTNLKKVSLPASLKVILSNAFSYLPNLEDVVYAGKKEGVKTEAGVFAGTPYLRDQPFELTTAYWELWDEHGNLVSNLWVTGCTGTAKVPDTIVIPDGVDGIADGAFKGLTGFTKVTIPKSVKFIWDEAFAGCEDLATVTFLGKKDDIYIEDAAFVGTAYSASLPFKLIDGWDMEYGYYERVYDIYGDWVDEKWVDFGESKIVWYVYGYVGTCPAKLDFSQYLTNGVGRVYIEEEAFRDATALKEVVLPDGVDADWGAFRYCENLATVTVGGKNSANKRWLTENFLGTPWLDTAVPFELVVKPSVYTNEVIDVVGDPTCCVPYDERKFATNEVVTVTNWVVRFYGNVPATLTFPADVGAIADSVFQDCNDITEVVVPGNVKTVGDWVFARCKGLQSVEFEEGVETIGDSVFYGCGEDMQVILPTSIIMYYDEEDSHWYQKYSRYTAIFNGIVGDVDVVAPRTTEIFDRAFQAGRLFGRTCVEQYTRVVLDANGGTFEGDADYRCFDDVVTGLPTPVRAGYVFREWWDEDDEYYRNGDEWGENQPQVCLTAAWATERKFYVYGLKGPTELLLGVGDDYETLLRVLADAYGTEPEPSRHGLTFRYWMVDGVEMNHRSEIGPNSTFSAFFDEFNPLTDKPESAVDATAAQTYDGYVLDYKGNNAGTIQVKVGRPNKKTGEASVSAKLQMFGTRKISFKADPKGKWKIASEGSTKGVTLSARNQESKIVIDISEKGIFGTYGDYDIIGSRNTSKKDAAYAKWSGKKYEVAFKTKEGTGSAFTGGYSGVTVSIANKGKVKLTGVMADGGKVNASAQLLLSDKGEGCVNVFVPMYTGKKGGFGFVLWIDPDLTTTHVESVSTWTSTDSKAPFTAELELLDSADAAPTGEMTFSLEAIPAISGATVQTDYLPKAVKATFDQRKFTIAKANKIKADRSGTVTRTAAGRAGMTDNDAGLKLTYTTRTGAFKGSFTVYTIVNSRLKKVKATVNGVFVKGVGYGSAVIKNVGSYPVTIR